MVGWSHRIDDEEFYIPYGLEVKDTESLFLMAYSWIGYYNTRRAHTGKNLDGKTPIEYAKEVMPELSRDIALFPPVILDNLTTSSHWKSVNKVPTHYSVNLMPSIDALITASRICVKRCDARISLHNPPEVWAYCIPISKIF
jgi:hypothetical protein